VERFVLGEAAEEFERFIASGECDGGSWDRSS
jgi:hypothetical protein